ncbi:MAG: aspartate kinase [Gammaproteobacteria bacterium]|nr:aspartate kinase [Gammaproteobacteria bacterium]MCP5199205.1 aspartate kinase [Gammaproteobacteria bacterium]
MALIVQKFGGTSVGDVDRIKAVAARVARTHAEGHQVVVVVSAMSGETDRLLGLARAFDANPRGRELDVILSTGEQVTIGLLCMALQSIGAGAMSFTGGQVRILTDSAYNKARIEDIDQHRVRAALDAGNVVVVAGFQGVDADGNITTLGRGGSDTTAVALAAALQADECQIYTDVDGVYTTDPRIVPEARRLDRITYEEMLEMASLGAKVLQIRSVEFASKYQVNLRVLSSFGEGGGTLITTEDNIMEQALISGVTLNRDEAQLTVTGVPDRPGIASGLLGPVADANIEVDMIVQNTGADGATDFTFTVHRNDYERTLDILRDVAPAMGARSIEGDRKIVKVSIVGVGMRSHAGIASRMFRALAAEGVNIRMISTSEIKISVVVDEKYGELAVRTLHDEFELENGAVSA